MKFDLLQLKQHAAEMLTKKHNTITTSDVEFWAWPQTFGSTNPHGPGGNAITTHTVIGLSFQYAPWRWCSMVCWKVPIC